MGFFDSLWGGIKDVASAGADFLAGSGIPIVSGIGSAASNLISKKEAEAQHEADKRFNAQQAQLNREWQTSERIASQDFNMQMWNLNNEYNSTENQLQRYMDAGGNPNAFFGGSTSAVAQPVTTSPGGPGAQGATGDGFASQLLTSDAVIRNLLAQAKLTDIEGDRAQFGLSWDKMTAPLRLKALENANKEAEERIRKIIAEVGDIEFNQELQSAMYEWYASKTSAEIKYIGEELYKLRAETRKTLAETKQISVETEGIKYDNIEKRIRAEVASITGAPADTPLGNLLFLLYKEGRITDMNSAITTTMIANGGYTGSLTGIGNMLGNVVADEVTDRTDHSLNNRWRKARYGVINPQR